MQNYKGLQLTEEVHGPVAPSIFSNCISSTTANKDLTARNTEETHLSRTWPQQADWLADTRTVGRGRSGRPARPRTTALLSPSSDGKPEAATAVIVAPDDGHEDAQNMLSCI